jgi:hypothetical protein
MKKIFLFCLPIFILAGCNQKSVEMNAPLQLRELASPAGARSSGPNLFAAGDGRIFLSWIARLGEKHHALRYAVFQNGSWSPSRTIAEGRNWFVNWADFPSLTTFADNALAAHWLAKSGEGTYAYNVNLALSTDDGASWSPAMVPHPDGTQTEHGFVSLLPWRDNRLFAVWLDGRNFANTNGHANHEPDEKAEMTLRFAAVDLRGELHDETVLDSRVCECCQTSAALTTNGAVLVYRDRSPEEIRDIAIVRYQNGRWTAPQILHPDNWVHQGCPVNGPAVAANGSLVAVAWYTEAQDTPHVRVAFSHDEGATFGQPIEVGDTDPMGRVDLILLPDQTALVSWLEHTDNDGAIRLRRVRADGWRGESFTLAQSSVKRASGFPRMASNGGEVIFAWTQSRGDSTSVLTAAAKLNGE